MSNHDNNDNIDNSQIVIISQFPLIPEDASKCVKMRKLGASDVQSGENSYPKRIDCLPSCRYTHTNLCIHAI